MCVSFYRENFLLYKAQKYNFAILYQPHCDSYTTCDAEFLFSISLLLDGTGSYMI